MTRLQSRTGAAGLLLAAVGALVISMIVAPSYSSFAADAVKAALVVVALVAIDAVVFRRTDTYQQIVVEKNVAYAVLLGAVAVAVGLAVGSF